jgi:hypothetical protein
MIFDSNNIGDLTKKVFQGSNLAIPEYKRKFFEKIKRELQVHTQGRLFDKVISVFPNEEQEGKQFILNTYESVTTGSIWKGIDNLSRIFNATGFNLSGDQQTINELSQSGFFKEYIEDFIKITTAKDPNSVQVWKYDQSEQKWESEFIESEFILLLNDDEIAFIDKDNSDYEIVIDNYSLSKEVRDVQYNYRTHKLRSYFEATKYVFGGKKRIIYISKNQYVQFDTANEKETDYDITNFQNPLHSPYTCTGVEEIADDVYTSPVGSFIPNGNHALIQHRTFRNVESLFGYPRMSELDTPCDNCVQGLETCDPCEEHPEGTKTCHVCNGSGNASRQSQLRVYKRRISSNPDLNSNVPVIEFYTPDTRILEYNSNAWKETLKLAEESIYIQQRVVTGNVESAKSREMQLESMYSWLDRIAETVYENINEAIQNFAILSGFGACQVEKPISYAIMSETEAFQYLNTIVSTDAPTFIKTTHVENFLNKYVSKTSPVIKIVEVLKRIDPFVFYTQKDIQQMSDSGVINDRDWRVHNYAFPLLSMMTSRDSSILEKEVTEIENLLNAELEKKIPRNVI